MDSSGIQMIEDSQMVDSSQIIQCSFCSSLKFGFWSNCPALTQGHDLYQGSSLFLTIAQYTLVDFQTASKI